MFLTRLPVPAWVDHHPAYLMRSMMVGAAFSRGVWQVHPLHCAPFCFLIFFGLSPPSNRRAGC